MSQEQIRSIYPAISLLALLALAGCATQEISDPPLSGQLEATTGHSIGYQTEPGVVTLPPGITMEDPLSVEDAVAIALWNNAAFQELLSGQSLVRADLVKAGEITNPTFMALFPAGPKQLEFAARFPMEAIWLRRKRLEGSELAMQNMAERMVQGGLDLVRDVKLACAALQHAVGDAKNKKETATIRMDLSRLADSSLAAGDISEAEAIQARIEAIRAEQAWQLAESQVALMQTRLHVLMGLGKDPIHFKLVGSDADSPAPINRSIEDLVKDALANRPDLRAAELAMEAAGVQVDLSKKEIYTLTVILDANDKDTGFEIGPGVDFTIPLFNQNQGNRAIADAKLQKAMRRYVTTRDQITLEVRESYLRWQQAVTAVKLWDSKLIPELQSAVRLANTAVDAGDLPPLALLEARSRLNAALGEKSTAVADWHVAVAELERAIGHRLDLDPVRDETTFNDLP